MIEKDMGLAYDEDDSAEFIQSCMPDDFKDRLSNDDINYLVDLIYEYYEEMGFLAEDADDDIDIDEDELADYVFKNSKSAKIKGLTIEMVEAVISGELAYCEALDDGDDDEDDE
ncbi:MAG TPA: hypothetical protein VFC69_03600 [Dysgonamonadaceae bacterium]|nr:hypothetical protein [Dysgonamonadaceae bacterium]